ncbi:hypothetical protein ACQ4PT_060651 [Festuca glaucescens]
MKPATGEVPEAQATAGAVAAVLSAAGSDSAALLNADSPAPVDAAAVASPIHEQVEEQGVIVVPDAPLQQAIVDLLPLPWEHVNPDDEVIDAPPPYVAPFEEEVNDKEEEISGDLIPDQWKVTFFVHLSKRQNRLYHGIVRYDASGRRIQLLCMDVSVVDARDLRSHEVINHGVVIFFPCHQAKVVARFRSELEVSKFLSANNHSDLGDVLLPLDESRMAVQASIALGLDFNPGMNFAKEVRNLFGSPVHPTKFSGHFTMIVSFGRATFRLSEDSVGLALEAAIGGYCGEMKVSLVRDRVFSFTVNSKLVGFHILSWKFYECFHFKCHFHLWGHGGLNWHREFIIWQKECDEEWTIVSPSKRRAQLGLQAMNSSTPKSALRSNPIARKNLRFAHQIQYQVCKGYTPPSKTNTQPISPKIASQHLMLVSLSDKCIGSKEKMVANESSRLKILNSTNTAASVGAEKAGSAVLNLVGSSKVSSKVNGLDSDKAQSRDEPAGLDGLEEVVNDIAFRFWECSRCLSMGHNSSQCVKDIRCRECFNYGHIAKNFFAFLAKKSKKWIPKWQANKGDSLDSCENRPDIDLAVPTPLQQSPPPMHVQPVPPPPPLESSPPPPGPDPSAMANFELDPTPWLPWGHHIIDGGPTRLPRTFYFPAQDPPPQHQSFCIAVVEPLQPPEQEEFWREQVRAFLEGPLNRHMIEYHPSLFGVGLFQLNGPNSKHALVQHGHYQLQANVFVRFIDPADAKNHRAAQGFCHGWLMFLGVPPDYRNDLDITNAVSTFGQYHFWNKLDPIKSRILVYASFPSVALVPRDVVFRKFGTVGGFRESWTAAVYILSADFAEQLPADEDQMPPDGNPHPMPGQMQPNMNDFILPPFPELGWNEQPAENNAGNVQHNDGEQGVMDQDHVPEQDAQESMVMHPSGNSVSSVNLQDNEVDQPDFVLKKVVRKRKGKAPTPVVQPAERRFTRSSLKLDGYKAQPVDAIRQTPRKQPRAKLLLVTPDSREKTPPEQQDQSTSADDMQIPTTPIHVMQRVGIQLGIDPAKLAKEKLEADPKAKNPEVKDD